MFYKYDCTDDTYFLHKIIFFLLVLWMKLVAFITCLLWRCTFPEKDSFFCARETAESKDSLSLHYLCALFFSFCGSNELLKLSLDNSSHTICCVYYPYGISGCSYPTLLVKVMPLWSKIHFVSRLSTKNDKFGLAVIKKTPMYCPLTPFMVLQFPQAPRHEKNVQMLYRDGPRQERTVWAVFLECMKFSEIGRKDLFATVLYFSF